MNQIKQNEQMSVLAFVISLMSLDKLNKPDAVFFQGLYENSRDM